MTHPRPRAAALLAAMLAVALAVIAGLGTPAPAARPGPSSLSRAERDCTVSEKLVPTCGVPWGVGPGAHTDESRTAALREFERKTRRPQAIYHAYHRGRQLFPTREEIKIAQDREHRRLLFLSWKPPGASWARIAAGDPETDAHLDRLARHIRRNFTEPFFFTVHHEPENDVRSARGSGWTAKDYAAMYRHVIERLRRNGVTNLVSVMVYMAYIRWTTKPWFESLYPGDDVVDWVAWDTYAYSDPGYGYGDFAEMVNRRSNSRPAWPGFYNWAASRFPHKPLMLAEWGVWHSTRNPGHMPYFFDTVARQIRHFPRIKALVYFDTPRDQRDYVSRVDVTRESLRAYRRLGQDRTFQVYPR